MSEKQFENSLAKFAIKHFLTVGLSFSMILFGILFLFTSLIYAASRSVTLRPLRETAIWWFIAGIVSIVVGSFILFKELKTD